MDLISLLYQELLDRLDGLPGTQGATLATRGAKIDHRTLPRVWVWITEDEVEGRAAGGLEDDPDTEQRAVRFEVGAITKNTAAVTALHTLVHEIRKRLVGTFSLDGKDYEVVRDSTQYDDEERETERPFASAAVQYHLNAMTPEGEA